MADIVLKDRNGNDVTYEGIETVTFDTPTEGEQVTFTEGVAVSEIPIALDFSGGDQVVTAPEGSLVKSATIKKPDTLTPENVRNGVNIGGVDGSFIGDTEEQTVELSMADGDMVIEPSAEGKVISKVTIPKPETLIPENIAEGIDIAGIIGSFKGGGAKIAIGSFQGNGSAVTVNHNLGVVPDIVCIATKNVTSFVSDSLTGICHLCGFSSVAIAMIGCTVAVFGALQKRTSSEQTAITISRFSNTLYGVDTDKSNQPINNANEESVTFGGTKHNTNSGCVYEWIAIAGIT